ncbi:MAG: 5-deoxy-glucuronate isomerase [Chloroflexota bacterium]|nr:5-deoxy-glucuronate isomerase [Chloroflexota bacterium]
MTLRPDELLLRSHRLDRPSGELVHVSPERAGWSYAGLAVRRLADGETWERPAGPDEVALVPLGGRCRVEALGRQWRLGERPNVFAGQPWALYLPTQTGFQVTADGPLDLAVCSARAEERHEPVLIEPGGFAVEIRGAGNAARHSNHILPPAFSAHRLLVVEVFTPSGNWSSYPPHKHDTSDPPREAALEEIAYHRFNPSSGFGFQRLHTADDRLDVTWVIRDGDLLLVPEGYHTFVAAHGYTAYSLNVLAGNEAVRTLQPSDDPDHGWVRGTWDPAMTEGLTSWRDIDAHVNGGAGRRR